MNKMIIRRLRYIFHAPGSASLISILICAILFTIIYQCSRYSVNADMRKTFTPRISIYEQHDDNIDLISNLDFARLDRNRNIVRFEKNSDWITMFSPGFSLNLDSSRTKMSLDYETRLSFYHREKNQDRDTDLHYGTARWEQQLSRNLKLEIGDTFSRSDDPILVSEEGLIEEEVGRRTYYRNNGQISVSLRFSEESSAGMGYRNLYLKNKSELYENSISHEFFFNLDTRLNPFWGIGLESRINKGRFIPKKLSGPRTENFYDYEGVITLNYRWHPSRSLFARYSLLAKEIEEFYEDEPGQDLESKDFRLHQISVGLSFVLSPHTNFGAEGGYFRQLLDKGHVPKDRRKGGVNFNIVLNTEKKKTTVSIGGSGGYSQEYFSSENLGSSKFKQVFGSVNYLLSKDLSAFLSANYRWDDFWEDNQGNSNRKDEVWRTSGGFYFSFSDWLTLSIDGSHSERESKSYHLEYNNKYLAEFIRDNRVMLRITTAYPIKF